jgi:hypothetical protein
VVCVEDLGSKDMLIGAFFTWTADESFALGRLISWYNVLYYRNCSSFCHWDCRQCLRLEEALSVKSSRPSQSCSMS